MSSDMFEKQSVQQQSLNGASTGDQEHQSTDHFASHHRTEKLIGEKVEKELKHVLSDYIVKNNIDSSVDKLRFNKESLFGILEIVGYLNTQTCHIEEVHKHQVQAIWILLTSQVKSEAVTVSYEDLKLVLFNAHGIYQPSWMLVQGDLINTDMDQQSSQDTPKRGPHFRFESKEEFDRFHRRVGKNLAANKAQTSYHQREYDLIERAATFDYDFRREYQTGTPLKQVDLTSTQTTSLEATISKPSPSAAEKERVRFSVSPKPTSHFSLNKLQYFKPMIDRNSERLDKLALDKKGNTATSVDRADLILQKGLEYCGRAQQKRETLKVKEVEGLTFIPKINQTSKSRTRVTEPQASENTLAKKVVFESLYKSGLNQVLKWRKDDRAVTDVEFEKQKNECTFFPKPIATKDLAKVFGKALVSQQISPRYQNTINAASASYSEAAKKKAANNGQLSKLIELGPQELLISGGKQPILYLEVNLGKSHQERLIICEGDHPDSVVSAFSQKHKLTGEKQKKLMNVVN